MSAIVGIDLGTSNSVVAWEDELGHVNVLSDRDDVTVHPSVVTFVDGKVVGGVVVGARAKAHKIIDPKNTVYSFKRLMGQTANSLAVRQARTRVPYQIAAGPDQMPVVETCAGGFTAVELSAILLDYLRDVAVDRIGRPVQHAVITVPANFNDAQRSATASAGAIAGLEVVRVLNEPTAAALAYGNTRRLNEIIAVYDFGGGTFDLTVMKLEDQNYTVLGTAGDSFLGGDDIDERIVDRMLANVIAEHRLDLRGDVVAMMKLRFAAEQLKIDLSTRPRAQVIVPDLAYDHRQRPLALTFELTHTDLVALISDLVDRTISVTRDALSVAQVKMERVSDVILVGGTTRIPYVRNRVAGFFERAARTDVSPEGAVAIGAALQAAALEQLLLREPTRPLHVPFDAGEPRAPDPDYQLLETDAPQFELPDGDPPEFELPDAEPQLEWPLADDSFEHELAQLGALPQEAPPRQRVIDVTPTSFGVGTLGGYCETLIWRSSPLPITIKKRYVTVRDDQDSVRIVVCQGETRRLTENVVLGDVVLGEIPRMPRGTVEIEVAFALDTSGMLQVSARDAATGQSRRVSLDLVGRMDQEEVAAARDRVQKLRR
jgi:molecular chaperone DnaK (HSP70)